CRRGGRGRNSWQRRALRRIAEDLLELGLCRTNELLERHRLCNALRRVEYFGGARRVTASLQRFGELHPRCDVEIRDADGWTVDPVAGVEHRLWPYEHVLPER